MVAAAVAAAAKVATAVAAVKGEKWESGSDDGGALWFRTARC